MVDSGSDDMGFDDCLEIHIESKKEDELIGKLKM